MWYPTTEFVSNSLCVLSFKDFPVEIILWFLLKTTRHHLLFHKLFLDLSCWPYDNVTVIAFTVSIDFALHCTFMGEDYCMFNTCLICKSTTKHSTHSESPWNRISIDRHTTLCCLPINEHYLIISRGQSRNKSIIYRHTLYCTCTCFVHKTDECVNVPWNKRLNVI